MHPPTATVRLEELHRSYSRQERAHQDDKCRNTSLMWDGLVQDQVMLFFGLLLCGVRVLR